MTEIKKEVQEFIDDHHNPIIKQKNDEIERLKLQIELMPLKNREIAALLRENKHMDDACKRFEQVVATGKKLAQVFPETIPSDQEQQDFNIPAYIVREFLAAIDDLEGGKT